MLAVLIAAFAFVLSHVKPGHHFTQVGSHETTIDVGGLEVLVGGIVIGTIAIILAGTMSWFATRRAVRAPRCCSANAASLCRRCQP